MNACLHLSPEGWVGYTVGYKTAGEILVKNVADTGADQDFLVYPIVFVYRHYLELILKEVRRYARQFLGQTVDFTNQHNLMKLWEEVRPLVETAWPNQDKPLLDKAEDIIRQLDQVDQKSFAFRYAEDRSGVSYIPGDLIRFNLRHFAESMGEVTDTVEAWLEHAIIELEAKEEMRREFGP